VVDGTHQRAQRTSGAGAGADEEEAELPPLDEIPIEAGAMIIGKRLGSIACSERCAT